MTGGADSALLTGEGKQILVVTVAAAYPEESLGEVAAAQKTVECVLQFWPERSQRGLVLGGVGLEEIFKGGFQALPEWRGLGLARAV